jgi:hypothetical protein
LQPDGKALVGGAFTNIAGGTHPRIARLGTNGILDLTFAPAVITNGSVFAVAPAPGGKVVIGGSFRFVNGVFRSGIARLNGDGSLDTSFHPGAGVTGTVYTVSVLTNGSVFIGGDFTTVNGTNRNRYALLRESGALDQIFDSTIGADNTVFASVITPDQKVIIGGDFMHVGGIQRRGVAKLVMAELSTIRITRPRIVSNAASLSMNSIAGRAYVLEGSSDLGYWVGLSTNVATGATLDFTDPNVSTNGQRFYRARRFGP